VLDASRPPLGRWFSGSEVNSCYNALDLHVERGRAEQTALIYGSPVTGTIKSITYRELLDEVARFAGVIVGAYPLRPMRMGNKAHTNYSDRRASDLPGRRAIDPH
jgi:hypothetical protein